MSLAEAHIDQNKSEQFRPLLGAVQHNISKWLSESIQHSSGQGAPAKAMTIIGHYVSQKKEIPYNK